MNYHIAIDGPAASGKSTTAKLVAKKLNMIHLNTGLLYRGVTYALEYTYNSYDLEDLNIKNFVKNLRFDISQNEFIYNNVNILDKLRTPKVDNEVISVARTGYVREYVNTLIYSILNEADTPFVVDGRDIGTTVIPNAFLKIFLTTSLESRARRRAKETGESYDSIFKDLELRDFNDINRKVSPLIKAKDAILVENDKLSIEETVDMIIGIYNERK